MQPSSVVRVCCHSAAVLCYAASFVSVSSCRTDLTLI